LTPDKAHQELESIGFFDQQWPTITTLHLLGGLNKDIKVQNYSAQALTRLNLALARALPCVTRVIYQFECNYVFTKAVLEEFIVAKMDTLETIEFIDCSVRKVTFTKFLPRLRRLGMLVNGRKYQVPGTKLCASTIEYLKITSLHPKMLLGFFYGELENQLHFENLHTLVLHINDKAERPSLPDTSLFTSIAFPALVRLELTGYQGDIMDYLSLFPLGQIKELRIRENDGTQPLNISKMTALESLGVNFGNWTYSDHQNSEPWTHPLFISDSTVRHLELNGADPFFITNGLLSDSMVSYFSVPDAVQLQRLEQLTINAIADRGHLVKLLRQLRCLRQLHLMVFVAGPVNLLEDSYDDGRTPETYDAISTSIVYLHTTFAHCLLQDPNYIIEHAWLMARLPSLRRWVSNTWDNKQTIAQLEAILDTEHISPYVQHLVPLLDEM
ncbi:hypothetical protein EC988_000723, partial [Linderina pennispora]